jgi:hypothetical protein
MITVSSAARREYEISGSHGGEFKDDNDMMPCRFVVDQGSGGAHDGSEQ